jgi:hypothetical protein
VFLNKLDLIADRGALEPILKGLGERGCQVLLGSGVSGEGVADLVRAMALALQEAGR